MIPRTRFICVSLFFCTLVATVGGIGGGCEVGGTSNYSCQMYIEDRKDDYGHPDPCCNLKPCCPKPVIDHYAKVGDHTLWDPCCLSDECPGVNVWIPQDDAADAGDASSDAQSLLCPGQCVPTPPEGWFPPVLLWKGSPDQEPYCPDSAPTDGYHGHADLVASSYSCSSCGCTSSKGECGLPSHLTASTNVCNAGGILTPFDAPAGWSGTCTAQDAIPGGAQCNGSPCVKSLSVEPLTTTESCTPYVIVPKGEPGPGPTWKTSALACQVSGYPPCSPTQVCAPPNAPGFSTCIFTWGDDHSCPEPYTERQVFYDDYVDTRVCTDCTCEPPVGSLCTAQLSLYKDNACVDLLASKPIASTDPGCVDFQPAGPPLGSKAITNLTYTPGSCQPGGGDEAGELTEVGVATFCCLQS